MPKPLLFLLILLTCTLTRCSNEPGYTILSARAGNGQCEVSVELETKIEARELLELSHKIKSEQCKKENGMVVFFVPSEYTASENNMWATVNYLGDRHQLYIYGTRNQAQKDKLLSIQGIGKVIGKWYFNDPVNESLFVLRESDDQYYLDQYKHTHFSITYFGGDLPEKTIEDKISDIPANTEMLLKNEKGNYWYPADDSTALIKYRIDKNGDLNCTGDCLLFEKLQKVE